MFRNRFVKNKSSLNWELFRKQRNLVTSIRRQSIRNYFQKQTTTQNNFWKIIKPFMTDKSAKSNDDIILREGDNILTDSQEICNVFNEFYTSAADSIGFSDEIPHFLDSYDMMAHIIRKYSEHSSIIEIKTHRNYDESFTFVPTNEKEVSKLLSGLNIKKAIGYDGIPAKIIKISKSYLTPIITEMINHCIDKCIFPDQLKLAEVSSVFKKNDRLCKENYRPISILIIVSKIYEKIFVNRMSSYMNVICNPLLSAYRTGYGCSDVLLKFILLWQKALDDNLYTGAIMMDLSKAFDCLPHCLLIAKLQAYGFSHRSCLLVASYLSSRKQRVKIGDVRSTWKYLNKGVPQGSIMGPFLFNFFIHDLYYFIERCTLLNYADDDTLVFAHKNINDVYSALSSDANISVKWFENNGMKANPGKFQFVICHRSLPTNESIHVSEMSLKPENSVKLLGVVIDKLLTFDKHVEILCKKASSQLNTLKRFSNILGEKQKLRIFQTFILSNFNYCPVIWNFCSKSKSKLIEKIHERGLRYVYNDYSTSYSNLLIKSKRESMYNIRLKKIVIYVYKCLHRLTPPFLFDSFQVKTTPYNMRSETLLVQPKVQTVAYGLLSFHYHGAKIWNNLPPHIKSANNLAHFKKLLRTYNQPLCTCSYCVFIVNL
jgi:hypothetical protein